MNNVRPMIFVFLLILFLAQFPIQETIAGIRCYARDSYSRNFIIAIQETLKQKGIDPGPVDGLWGPKTERGIATFQRMMGLNYGLGLNGPTLRALFGDGFDPKRYGLEPNPGMPPGIFEQHCR